VEKNGTKPVCAWVSQHPPTTEQREALGGYEICEINLWFRGGEHVWQVVTERCPQVALILAVIPYNQYFYLVRAIAKARRDVPVIRAVMEYNGQEEYHWTGRWQRVYGIQLLAEEWQP
jgi:hypothetical protein